MHYYAFISYSHRDEKFATWLMEAIETYRVPSKLVGRDGRMGVVPNRPFPVFRDRDELVGANLSERINAALADSSTLVVICSPAAAASHWVNEEVKTFRRLHGRDRVLCIIPPKTRGLDGAASPLDAPMAGFIPPAVTASDDGDNSSPIVEPVVADARPDKDGLQLALFKVLAGVLGAELDELAQRDRQRRARQRFARGLALAAALVALFAGYTLVADAGVSLPGGEALRRVLDRYQLSVVRAVPGDRIVQAAIDTERALDLKTLQPPWDQMHLPKADGEMAIEPWSVAQMTASVLATQQAPPEQVQAVLEIFEKLFDPQLRREADGILYGWEIPQRGFTQAEPALWVLCAIGRAHTREPRLPPEVLTRLYGHLEYAQHVADSFRPHAHSGRWNMFAQQKESSADSVYTTTLALLGLLDLYSARLGWLGDQDRLATMIHETCDSLQDTLDVTANPPGWRVDNAILDGLTLQIYTELLRAHRELGLVLKPAVAKGAAAYLEQLHDRPVDFPVQTERLFRVFKNFDGRATDYTNTIITLWRPWAISACNEWLAIARTASPRPAPEQVVAIRRSLAHLAVTLPDARKAEPDPAAYKCSEMLYGLSSYGLK